MRDHAASPIDASSNTRLGKGRVTVPGKLSADLYPGRLKSILCSGRRRAVHLFDCQLADYHARRSRSLVYCLWMKLRQTPKLTRKVTAGHVQTMRRTCECGLQPRAAVLRYDDPLLTREVSARRHVKAVIRAVIDYVQASPLARKFCPELKGPIGPLGKNPMLATEIAARRQSKFVILAIINNVETLGWSRKTIAQYLL